MTWMNKWSITLNGRIEERLLYYCEQADIVPQILIEVAIGIL